MDEAHRRGQRCSGNRIRRLGVSRQEAAAQDLPAYCVFTDATLVALAEARPANSEELIKVTGIGPTKAEKYGDHVLAILAQESSPAAS